MNATLAVPPATPASRHVPLSISISSPQDPIPADGQAVFRGPVKGLHPGETIWLFSKQVTDRSGAPVTSGVVLINAGPCDVAKDIWRCPKTRVGGPGARDEGSYRIWVTVLSPREVRILENDLVNSNSVLVDHNTPLRARSGRHNKETLLRK